MDFLDPKKQRRHTMLLMSGYILISIAIALCALVLIWQSHGFGVNKNGQVVQNGFVFVSSQPNGAQIYLDNELESSKTNTRLSVATGAYTLTLKRAGYRDWSHPLAVLGGDVQHFDYPFLFPTKLDTTKRIALGGAAGMMTQSHDKRWILVQQADTNQFALYDVKNPTTVPEPVAITLPATVVSEAATAHTWTLVQWANDNQHILLAHTLSTGTEYVLVDREDPIKSVNLNKVLGVAPTQLTLLNTKSDRYAYIDTTGTLNTVTLDNPTQPTALASGVISYKTYGTDEVAYTTAANAPEGKVWVELKNGDNTYPIRQLSANATYLLDIASYDGAPYVIAGSSVDGAVYIYKDPIGQLKGDDKLTTPKALSVLRVPGATYESFSPTAQYIVVQNGTSFGVQDLELHRFRYYDAQTQPLDAPQLHASWMDGNRLTYVSGGKSVVFDFDNRNRQTLMRTDAATGLFFAPNYKYTYTLGADATGAPQLIQTSLLTTVDR